MKKTLTFLILAAMAITSWSQLVSVGSIEELALSVDEPIGYATLSPSGNSLFISDPSFKGLTKVDLSDRAVTKISDEEGAGYNPLIVDDSNVAYREISYTKDNLKKTALRSVNINTGKRNTIVEPTRTLNGAMVSKGNIYAINNGKVSVKGLAKGAKSDKQQPVLSISDRQLMLTVNGTTRQISPNGAEESYIWPSVSPDGKKALYFVCGEGAYVSNIDGTSPRFIGIIRAPKWLNNNLIIGMQDIDDGYITTESTIVAADVNTLETQTLTDNSIIAMYPSVDEAASKVAFTSNDGKVYLMSITVK